MRRAEQAEPCKHCGSPAVRVINTRPRQGYRYRQYRCEICGTFRTSAEFIVDILDDNVTSRQIMIAMLGEFSSEDLLKELLRRNRTEEIRMLEERDERTESR